MVVNCDKCKKNIKVWEHHHIIETSTYCDECYTILQNNKSKESKIKNFFKINKYKIIITIWLYISMTLVSLFFFKPLLKDINGMWEIVAQLGFVINFPVMFLVNTFNIKNLIIQSLLSIISVFLGILWNYFFACELYYLYNKLISKNN